MITLFYINFPDLPHICQNLNQFGHGRGTIYGGKNKQINKENIK